MTQLPANPIGFDVEIPVAHNATPATLIVGNEQSVSAITVSAGDGSSEFSIPVTAYSLTGFRDWALSDSFPRRGRFTFSSEGLIVDMSPESLENHNYIKADISLVVHGLIRQLQLGRFVADRALYSNELANISTEPDAMFISGNSVQTGRCTLVESKAPGVNIEVLGSPDWVMEVVSRTSIRKDKIILRDGYFRAGVGEYWIVDALGEEIDFQILVPGVDGYSQVEACDGWLASPIFGASFQITVEKDRSGFLQYMLQVRVNS